MELAFRARLPGPIHLQTRRAQPGDDSDNGAARQNTQQKRGCHYHGAHPVLTPSTGQPLCASLTDSDLLTPSAKVPTPRRTCHPKLIGHSLRLAAHLRPKIGCHPADSDQTTSNMDPDKARQGALRPTAYGPGARASMITSQIYRVLSQDTHTEPPASTNYDTTSRPLTDSDQETQTDQSTKAATQPAVWWHHLHEPRPS